MGLVPSPAAGVDSASNPGGGTVVSRTPPSVTPPSSRQSIWTALASRAGWSGCRSPSSTPRIARVLISLVPRILAINLGASSSKLALFEGRACLCRADAPLAGPEAGLSLEERLALRRRALDAFLAGQALDPAGLSAVAARGGLLKPLPEYGAYRVDSEMLADLRSERYGSHPAGLSALLAVDLLEARGLGLPVYVVDPVSVDTLWDRARLSGIAGIERSGKHHALNIHAAMQEAARRLGQPLHRLRLVVAHFGSGVSIASVERGRVVDVNDAQLGEGPFSVTRAGTLPLCGVLDLAYSGEPRSVVERRLAREGGLFSYTGSGDLREVEARIEAGDGAALAAWEALLFQSAKYIAAAAGALAGRPDALVLTGALLHSERFRAALRIRSEWLAPTIELPGEQEMEALAEGALAVLEGRAPALDYAEAPAPQSLPPRDMDELLERAAQAPACRYIVAGAGQPELIAALKLCRARGLGGFSLLGNAAEIHALLAQDGLPADAAEVCDSADVVADAIALARGGPGAVLVKGACDSAALLRGVLEALPRAPRPFLSHAALIENPFSGKLVAVTDGGLNPEPDLEAKVRIMLNAAGLLARLGQPRPRVLLAAGMEDKGQSASAVADAREMLARHRAGEWPELRIAGPAGIDAGLCAAAAAAKGLRGEVFGRADVIVAPSLEACNFAVKLAHLYGGRPWAGLLLGGPFPVVLGSRADDAPSRLASFALARLAAAR